jgi:hypothetical protein
VDANLSYQLTDPFPFASQFVEGAKDILASILAAESGLEPLPSVQQRARDAKRALLAFYVIAPNAGQDPGAVWDPSERRYGFR